MRGPVIFDCDGVLVDSEPLSWNAWQRCVELYGVSVTDEDIAALTGHTADAVYDELAGRGDLPPRAELLASVDAITSTLFTEQLESFEDAEDTADHLRQVGFRLGVASSSSASRLELSLRVTGMADLFEVTVAGDQVLHPKPAPDIYLAVADALGVDPSDCIAVEDSPAGITAGQSAGMWVIAVERGFASEAIRHADLVVPRLTPAVFLG